MKLPSKNETLRGFARNSSGIKVRGRAPAFIEVTVRRESDALDGFDPFTVVSVLPAAPDDRRVNKDGKHEFHCEEYIVEKDLFDKLSDAKKNRAKRRRKDARDKNIDFLYALRNLRAYHSKWTVIDKLHDLIQVIGEGGSSLDAVIKKATKNRGY